MFCKFCGKKLETNVEECPYCGQKQEQLANGNGFWDLCNRDVSADGSPDFSQKDEAEERLAEPEADVQEEPEKKEIKEKGKGYKGISAVLLLICVISLFLNIVQMMEVNKVSLELKNLVSELSALRGDAQENTLDDIQEEPYTDAPEKTTGISSSANDGTRSPSVNDVPEIHPEEPAKH